MNIDFALNDNGDLDFSNGSFNTVSGSDKVIQKLIIRLRFVKGEWFLDTTQGMPYYQDIFLKGTDVGAVESAFKVAIINTEGVDRLLSFDLNLNGDRELKVDFSIEINGEEIEQAITL